MTYSVMASRRSELETFSLCCVEITTQSTRAGRPLRYSMVTCDFPSGRRKSTLLALRISERRCVRRWASWIGMGINSSVSSQRSEEHTSELQSQSNLVCRLLLEKKKTHTAYSCTNIRTANTH